MHIVNYCFFSSGSSAKKSISICIHEQIFEVLIRIARPYEYGKSNEFIRMNIDAIFYNSV